MNDLMERIDKTFATLSRLLITMRMAAYVFACYSIVQGSVIFVGGDLRFSAAGYGTAMRVPWSPEIWGLVIGFAGVLGLYGVRNRAYFVGGLGMLLGAVWSLLFSAAFLISAVQSPEANLTAIVAYGKDAILFTLMASAYRAMWQQEQKDVSSDDED